jgi:4-hydroxybenzoate polyprenyltransferase
MTPLLSLLRPVQWVKNFLVLAGVFFAWELFVWESVSRALVAFVAFCLASSAVYVLNDAIDAESDRLHPRKRLRPIASGAVSMPAAAALGIACAVGAIALALWAGSALVLVLVAYGLINIAYSRGLKHVVLLDVFCIAAGFTLRLLAGTWGIGIPPSKWFVLSAFLLSLFLGFSKRYAERIDVSQEASSKRAVVEEYSPEFLRMLLAVTLTCTLMTYGLYTMNPETVAIHDTERLVYTLPFAAFAMFRYLYLVMRRGFGENLSGELIRDRGLLAGIIAYLIVTAGVLM